MAIIKKGLRFLKNKAKKVIFFIPSSEAYYFLTKFQNEYSDFAIFITSYALGDLVYAMAYLKAWHEQNQQKKIMLIADPNKKEVIESYTDFYEAIYYERSTKMGKNVLVHLNGSRFYSFIGRKRGIYNTIPDQIYGHRSGRDNLDLMREYLGLPNESEIVYPRPRKVPITSIPDFEKSKNRIVIINPYSSGETICRCAELFNKIVVMLKNKDFIVYSNIVGEQKPLKETCPLMCGLLEIYSIAEEIPLIVSVRSGIMDWIVSTNSKKLVVYNADIDDGFSKMFDLSAWKTGNCKEIHMANTTDAEALNILEEYISRCE